MVSFFEETAEERAYGFYYDYCFVFFILFMLVPLIFILLLFLCLFFKRRNAGKSNVKLVSFYIKIIAVILLIFLIPSILFEITSSTEYLRPFFFTIFCVIAFFSREYWLFRWIVAVGYIVFMFLEISYYLDHAFQIQCIIRKMCVEEISFNYHMMLYWKCLLVQCGLNVSIYLIAYLMIALGYFSDEKEYLIRDLDEYEVRRAKTLSIYDFVHSRRPYYSSLKENRDKSLDEYEKFCFCLKRKVKKKEE